MPFTTVRVPKRFVMPFTSIARSPSQVPPGATAASAIVTRWAREASAKYTVTSAGPARVFGIAGKGRVAPGFDADLTIVDLAARRTIRNGEQATRCGWTPFDGTKVVGWPMATVLRGKVVMRDGQVVGEPGGRPLRFIDAMPPSAAVE